MEKNEIVINNEIQLLAFQKKLEDAQIEYYVRNSNGYNECSLRISFTDSY